MQTMLQRRERALHALWLRRLGLSLSAVAAAMNISRERARQLSKYGLQLERNDPWDELGKRAQGVLIADGCEGRTPADVMRHIEMRLDETESRYYRQSSHLYLRMLINCAAKTTAEIEAWLARHDAIDSSRTRASA